MAVDLFPRAKTPKDLTNAPPPSAAFAPRPRRPDPLFAHAAIRRSNKEPYDMSRPVPSAVLARIAAAAQRTEVGFTDDPAEVAELRALTVRAMEIEIDTPRTFRESVELFRIGRREVEANPDGLEFRGPTFEAMRLFGLFTRQAASDPESTAFQQGRTATTAPIDTAVAHIWTVTPDNARASQIAAGRDWLRLNLAAAGEGVGFHPLSQALQEYPEMAAIHDAVHARFAPDGGTVQMLSSRLRPQDRADPALARRGQDTGGVIRAALGHRRHPPARPGARRWAGGAAGRGGPCTPRAAPLPIARTRNREDSAHGRAPRQRPQDACQHRLAGAQPGLARHKVIDASWYLPEDGRDPKAEYNAAHIPGARFFDIDEIADTRSDLPHMAPPPEKFMSRMRKMGVGDGHQVVVYDGPASIPRRARLVVFRLMGKTDVAVLDGGCRWRAAGHPIEDMPPVLRERHLTARRQAHLVRDVTQVAAAMKLGDHEIVDARGAERFQGQAPEPRAGCGRAISRDRRTCITGRCSTPMER